MTASDPPATADPPIIATPARRRTGQASPVAAIILYLIFVFLGAALIAPRLYASAQFLVGISYRFSFLADPPFHRFVSRCLILLAILGLPSLLKALGLRSATVLGFKCNARHIVEAIQGFAWAFVSLALLAALLVTFDTRVLNLDHNAARWMQHLKNAALAAILVSFFEELLFRGALFGSLRQRRSFLSAALLSSALYALLHFLERPEHVGRVHWDSGLAVLGQMLGGFRNFQEMIPAFFNLTLVGCLLALVFDRTGSILLSIGLHAGFVFWLKTLNFVTDPAKREVSSFWGSDRTVDGWATSVVLLLTFLLVERTLPPRRAVST